MREIVVESMETDHAFKVIYIMGHFAKECRICFKPYKMHAVR